MCTTICTPAKAMTVSAVTVLLAMTPDITSQNGMAVRMTERPKPIR